VRRSSGEFEVKLLCLLVGGFAAAICGLVLMVLSVIAAMPWLGAGVPDSSGQAAPPVVIHVRVPAARPVPAPMGDVPPPLASSGNLSAAQRYQLAPSVGFMPAEAVMALAVALAENAPGNPNAINQNTPPALPDYGLWQINGSHAAIAGGVQNLFDPVINARVALQLSHSGSGWLQWCTVPHGCGGLPGVPNFASLLAQAQTVAASFAAR
jgi:hypothetical protein